MKHDGSGAAMEQQLKNLTHFPLYKMVANSQMMVSDAF